MRLIQNIVAIVLIGLTVSTSWLGKSLFSLKQEKNRIEQAFEASNQELEFYKTDNGKLVAKLEVMELKSSELKHIFPEILSEIKSLKIASKQVNHYSETVIHQEKEIIQELRDSIVLDTIRMKAFDYHDTFYDVSGDIRDDSIRMNIISRDSIIQVVYEGKRRKPWLWILSKRQLEQVIQCKNPNASIHYSKSIQITK